MKHILLFEAFDDVLGPMTRDFFDLNHRIFLNNGYILSGPIEHSEEAGEISKRINSQILRRCGNYDYSCHERVLAEYAEELSEIGYSYPDYTLALYDESSDSKTGRVYVHKEYEEFPIDIENLNIPRSELVKSVRSEIKKIASKYKATHILDDRTISSPSRKLIPIEEYF